MEEHTWFTLLRDTLSIAGNLAECVGLLFLFTQFRSTGKTPPAPVKKRVVRQRVPEKRRERIADVS
ncbi:hypothetical protein [Tumebacillus permanentifrigoris]|uniref:Uncharacterized protein n=1 Tax=Tumebacillus permanentifrigoris TaxID=378543 RepID=A0A316DUV6_9BACL|nr:hypothetical protein [Tumebacillus permanentifrigoris]PWK12852.1 hypothetical protein C7459_109214 [Tumebacillus permanentifrigoris]